MPLDAIPVGSNLRTVVTIGDPVTASQYQAVPPVGDAINPSGRAAALSMSILMLVDPGGNLYQARAMPGATGIQSVSIEGVRTCFSYAVNAFTPAATATDFFTIYGSNTKTVRIIRIILSGTATAAATNDILLIRRSTANTGGTSTNPTPTYNDSNGTPAATAVLTLYSVNPTLGTAVGTIRARKLNLGADGAAGIIEWNFGDKNDQMMVLRGATQGLCLNWNGVAVPGGTVLTLEIEFAEDNS